MNVLLKIRMGHYELTEEQRRLHKSPRHMLQKDMVTKFKQDALQETGLVHYEKFDDVWEKAWEDGHAYGYEQVLQNLYALKQLLPNNFDQPRMPAAPGQVVQSQRSCREQLVEAIVLANRNGLYDAADFIKDAMGLGSKLRDRA